MFADNPRGYWRMGETGGNPTVIDGAGAMHGTVVGGVTLGRPGGVFGDADTAAHFNGVDSQVNIPDAFHPTAYTVEALVNLDGTRSQSIILRTAGDPNLTWSHQLAVNAAGQFVHYAWDGSVRSVTGTTTAVPGQWYHVAGTAQGGGPMRLFVNGVEEGPATTIGTPWAGGNQYMVGSTSGNAVPGESGARARFEGTIDEVALYPVALSAADIAEHARVALVPEPGSLAVALLAGGALLSRRRR